MIFAVEIKSQFIIEVLISRLLFKLFVVNESQFTSVNESDPTDKFEIFALLEFKFEELILMIFAFNDNKELLVIFTFDKFGIVAVKFTSKLFII